MTLTPINDITSYKDRRQRMSDVLVALLEVDHVEGAKRKNSFGKMQVRSANQILRTRVKSLKDASDNQILTVVNDLGSNGWLDVERNKTRISSIRLTDEARASLTGTVIQPELPVPPIVTEAKASVALDGDTQSIPVETDVDERPGRVSARLEKSLPPLIEDAVLTAMQVTFDTMFNSLGYYQGIDPATAADQDVELQALRSQVASLQSTIESLNEDVRMWEADAIYSHTELNLLLRRSNDGMQATKQSLTVSALPEPLRNLGKHALDNGWTIHHTRGGGHLLWRSPKGEAYYGSKTPSDSRGARNQRAHMERMGLPKLGS